jgi:membrane protein
MKALRRLWRVLYSAGWAWFDDRAPSMGAAIAFYTIFSLAPTLLLVIAVAGIAFGEEAARGALIEELSGMIGAQAGEALQTMIANAGRFEGGAFATAIGLFTLLFGATTVFAELQDALNRIWKAQPPDLSTITALVRARFFGLALIMAIGFVLVVALVVSTVIAVIGAWLLQRLPGLQILLRSVELALSIGLIGLLFTLIYRFLPDTRVPWADAWAGGLLASVLFSLGKWLIGLYIGRSAVASTYGAAGTFVVILLWVYYSSLIFLYGAEVVKAWGAGRR